MGSRDARWRYVLKRVGRQHAVAGEEPRRARAGRHAAGGRAARELLGQPARRPLPSRRRRTRSASPSSIDANALLERRSRRRDRRGSSACIATRTRSTAPTRPSSGCGRPSREPSSTCAAHYAQPRIPAPPVTPPPPGTPTPSTPAALPRTAAACSSGSVHVQHRCRTSRCGRAWRIRGSATSRRRSGRLREESRRATRARFYVNRWRLEKKDPGAAVSEPVKPILVWMSNEIPEKYREAIRRASSSGTRRSRRSASGTRSWCGSNRTMPSGARWKARATSPCAGSPSRDQARRRWDRASRTRARARSCAARRSSPRTGCASRNGFLRDQQPRLSSLQGPGSRASTRPRCRRPPSRNCWTDNSAATGSTPSSRRRSDSS